jgi:hypothetical protein
MWLDKCKEFLVNVAQDNFCACSKGEAGFASDRTSSYIYTGSTTRQMRGIQISWE